MQTAKDDKEEGNAAYRKEDVWKAARRYSEALQVLNAFCKAVVNPAEAEEVEGVAITVYNNMAQLNLQMAEKKESGEGMGSAKGLYTTVVAMTHKVLARDPKNVKAILRQTRALAKLGDTAAALQVAVRAATEDPANRELAELVRRFRCTAVERI